VESSALDFSLVIDQKAAQLASKLKNYWKNRSAGN